MLDSKTPTISFNWLGFQLLIFSVNRIEGILKKKNSNRFMKKTIQNIRNIVLVNDKITNLNDLKKGCRQIKISTVLF